MRVQRTRYGYVLRIDAGEYVTPVGQLRFGRMPNHWGMGMVHNAGWERGACQGFRR